VIGRAVPKGRKIGTVQREEKRSRILTPEKLVGYIKPEQYIPELSAEDRDAVLGEMACALSDQWPSSECDCIEGLLMAREQLGTTALGKGLAVPHVRTALVTNLTVVVARSKEGVPFRAPDGKRAHIFFLVLGPHDDPGNIYLSFLATLVKAFKIRGLKGRLLKAASFEDFIATMEDALRRE